MRLLHPDGVEMDFHAPFGWPLDAAMQAGRFEGLPYPLQDMRPQGFLGRYSARFYAPVLQVSTDPHHWSDDDALHAISLLGSDTPGDLLVGERACAQWREHLRLVNAGQTAPGIRDDDVPAAFPSLARLVLTDGLPGSSAGGEFPKFTTMRRMPDGSLPVERSISLSAGQGEAKADGTIQRVESAAHCFWRTTAEDARLSPEFRQLCEARAHRLTLHNPPIADHRA